MSSALGTVLLSDAMMVAQIRGASDVHLSSSQPPMVRVDGALERMGNQGLYAEDLDALENDLLGDDDRRKLRATGDVTSLLTHDGVPVRVHAFRAGGTTAFALRFLARSLPTLEELGVPVVIARLVRKNAGLVIIGGPTGSGKSTSLAALLTMLGASEPKKILTIEDPIEYTIAADRAFIVQRQVGRDVGDFASAVRGALRSDPDIIAIGEMRDQETVASAIVAAETGHLVLGTLHTADAAQTVDRLVDAFPSDRGDYVRGRIAQVLLGVMCQRLLRRNDGGRVLAAEILISTDAVRHMIRDGKQHQLPSVIATGRRFGMHSLESHISELVGSGAVQQPEAECMPA